jgi:predicted nuclease of restriction endonuclease-like (RecB) superfamily
MMDDPGHIGPTGKSKESGKLAEFLEKSWVGVAMDRFGRAAEDDARTEGEGLDVLLPKLRGLILEARRKAATAINSLQVATNYEIGRLIVEQEQQGSERATYGASLIKELSIRLSGEFGKGFSPVNLSLMRKFYLLYRDRRGAAIFQTPSEISGAESALSWSHHVLLLSVKDQAERDFYEIEAGRSTWSVAELRRQMESCLYERLALSRDKEGIARLALEGHLVSTPGDMLKEPYVLEFLGLHESERYSEADLEGAIIARLEEFLLELGKGFLFEARQRRFTFDEEHFFVDLVFYNRLLRCYVLIDLKLGKVSHQDLGQMQMYVNYFDQFVKTEAEERTIGIILCKRKNDAIVKLTLPPDANIHAKEYQLYLPSKEVLRDKLLEWTQK